MIRFQNITKRYQKFTAVNDLSLNIGAARVFGFLGPNGAGKTTTIRMLTGILEPDEGHIEVFGLNYKKKRNEILNRLGYIPDRPYLYGKLTAMELLLFLGSLRKLDRAWCHRRGMALLQEFALDKFAHQLVERFSHGMRQKLVFAAALLHEPDLLIVDEPMVGLDPRAAKQVKSLIAEFKQKGRSVFMSTHTLEVAAQVCDEVGIIYKGKLIRCDTVPSLTQSLAAPDGDLETVFMALTEEKDDEAIPE